jgi:tRNA(fMet)-specific endonuclease VapC
VAVKRILVDTNLYVDFKRGSEDAVEVLRLAGEISISTVVLGELLAGFAGGSRERRNREELAAFLDSPRVVVRQVDEATADFYATVFTLLRQKGRPIPSNDLWIAATALQHGLILATRDEHFAEIDALATASSPAQLLP